MEKFPNGKSRNEKWEKLENSEQYQKALEAIADAARRGDREAARKAIESYIELISNSVNSDN